MQIPLRLPHAWFEALKFQKYVPPTWPDNVGSQVLEFAPRFAKTCRVHFWPESPDLRTIASRITFSGPLILSENRSLPIFPLSFLIGILHAQQEPLWLEQGHRGSSNPRKSHNKSRSATFELLIVFCQKNEQASVWLEGAPGAPANQRTWERTVDGATISPHSVWPNRSHDHPMTVQWPLMFFGCISRPHTR